MKQIFLCAQCNSRTNNKRINQLPRWNLQSEINLTFGNYDLLLNIILTERHESSFSIFKVFTVINKIKRVMTNMFCWTF